MRWKWSIPAINHTYMEQIDRVGRTLYPCSSIPSSSGGNTSGRFPGSL